MNDERKTFYDRHFHRKLIILDFKALIIACLVTIIFYYISEEFGYEITYVIYMFILTIFFALRFKN